MREKMVMCLLAVLFLAIPPAQAQKWPSVDSIVDEMQTGLDLNKDQVAKVKIVVAENLAKRQQVTPQLSQGLTAAQSQPLDAELYAKLSQIFTSTQMSKCKVMSKVMQPEV
jgi:hypothetical protein